MMNTTSSLSSIDNRIALIRDNIRQLVEQAAAYSGAQDEARTADRIDQQNKELEDLIKARDEFLRKQTYWYRAFPAWSSLILARPPNA
jgi:hypothetical protein